MVGVQAAMIHFHFGEIDPIGAAPGFVGCDEGDQRRRQVMAHQPPRRIVAGHGRRLVQHCAQRLEYPRSAHGDPGLRRQYGILGEYAGLVSDQAAVAIDCIGSDKRVDRDPVQRFLRHAPSRAGF